jgi:serine/threonine-protein kinase
VIGQRIGEYNVLSILGRGGMGTVYLAEHVTLDRKAAIKVLHPEHSSRARVAARFADEARAAARIKHPGIVEVYDFGHHVDGCAYLVMELLEGESLAKRLRRDGPMPEAPLVGVWRQAAEAVSAAHAAGVLHRDLKPDNLFLVRDPSRPWGISVKVLDFGVARLVGEETQRLTLTGTVVGTPTYMAPEQCKNSRHADASSEVYALGCIAFEMATGRPPFLGKGMAELMTAHIQEPPPLHLIHGVLSPELCTVIARSLSKAKEGRPRTMPELIDAIDGAGAARAEARSDVARSVTAPMEAVDETLVDPPTIDDVIK